MRRMAMVAVVVVVALVAGLEALADDESDKVSEINSTLDEIGGYLQAFPGDSSTSSADSAIDRADKVKSLAEEVRSLGPQSDDGKDIADHYADYADQFMEAARRLREMKSPQQSLANLGVAAHCNQTTDKLKETIQTYVDKNDPSGITELPRLGARMHDEIDALTRQQGEYVRDLERDRDDAHNFSVSDGHWDGVRSSLYGAADGVVDLAHQSVEDASRACADLAKGAEHPLIVDALRTLNRGAASRSELIKHMRETLDQIGGSLDRVAGASDASDVEHAKDLLSSVDSDLDRLGSAVGQDQSARHIHDTWPGLSSSLRQALVALGGLKRMQAGNDNLVGFCKDAVQQRGDALSKGDKGAGRAAIDLARALGDKLQQAFAAAEGQKSTLASLASTARGFSTSEAPWSVFRDKLSGAADKISEHWTQKLAEADEKCQDTRRGADAEKFKAKLKGKCTRTEAKMMDAPVDEFCKRERSCRRVRKDCDKLREYLELNQKCAAARDDINTWCFDGGDETHRDEADKARRAADECTQFISEDCGS